MFGRRIAIVATAVFATAIAVAAPAGAHPAPFSYLDVHVDGGALDVTLVAHIFDLGHDLGVDPPERLLEGAVLTEQGTAIARLLQGRLQIVADGQALAADPWSEPEPLSERQSIRIRTKYRLAGGGPAAGRLSVTALMFPYNPVHQTFVTFSEGDTITAQAILDRGFTHFDYFQNSRPGAFAALRRFLPEGIRHILTGPEHWLFLLGLLILGGSTRRLIVAVTAFTAAHALALSLALFNVLSLPERLIEPAIALTLVYLGADNLLVHGGRDVRAWIAFAFGLVHGFGFAAVLRDVGLPGRTLGWTLASFNAGLEAGQLMVVLAAQAALTALRSRSEWAGRQLAFAGSIVVIAVGAFWFVQRVFFAGGIS